MSRLLPDPGYFLPAVVKHARWRRGIRAAASRARDALHLTHADCLDGAACDALVRLALGDDGIATAWLDPAESARALELLAGIPGRGRRLVVSDLSFQRGQGARVAAALEALARDGWRIEWRDHHAKQWTPEDVARLAPHGAVRIDTAGTECGATLVAADLLPGDRFATELAAVVRDHDLWLRKDPRSAQLQNAARALGSEGFVRRLLGTRDLADAALLDAAGRAERAKAEDTAWGLARARTVQGRAGKVGAVYGDAPTNEVLHDLLENQGCDAAVMFKPSGALSLRSRKGVEVCHLVGQRFSGGGHPNASGGHLRLPAWRMPLYWARRDRDPAAERVVAALLAAVEDHKSAGRS